MLGLVREEEGVAARILLDFDADSEKIRNEVIRMLSGPGGRRQGAGVGGGGEGKKSSKLLDQFGRNLTKLASEGKLDPMIGRDTDIERVVEILSRRKKNNPVLLGEPGVGKTASSRAWRRGSSAASIPVAAAQQAHPHARAGRSGRRLQVPRRVRGAPQEGDDEVTHRGEIILFIDELHNVVGTGASDGAIDAASNMLKPALANGQLQSIGATTLEEYRKYLESDSALEAGFSRFGSRQPSVSETIEILEGPRPESYEEHHQIEIRRRCDRRRRGFRTVTSPNASFPTRRST